MIRLIARLLHRSRPHRVLWFHDTLSGRDISFQPGQHLFIAGQTGAGKSRLMYQMIRNLVEGGPVTDGLAVVYGIDLKDGVEYERWRGRMKRVATNLDEAVSLMEEVDRLRADRNQYLREHGLTKVEPRQDMPLVFVFIDEAAELTAGVGRDEKQRQEQAQRLLSRLLRLGRSAGITVIAATQDPRVAAFPLRDRFPNRIGLSLVNKDESVMLMGADAVKDGCAPHAIPLSRPGTGYWYDREHHQAVKFRTSV